MKENLEVPRKVGIKALGAVALAFLLLGVGVGVELEGPTSSASVALSAEAPQGLPDFVTFARKLKPVVVNISATQTISPGQQTQNRLEQKDQFDEFWDRFFGNNPRHGCSPVLTTISY